MRIEVLMVRPETTFYRRLSRAFERIAATLDPLVVLHRSFCPEMNPALIALLRSQAGRPLFFVGHELTDYTAAALRDGVMDVVLDQAPEAQARRALDLILRRIGLTRIQPDAAPIRFITITAESL